METLLRYQWEIWSAVALLFLVLELTAGDFFMLCLAAGAVAAAVAAGAGGGVLLTLGVFAVVSVLCLFLLRPRALRRFGRGKSRPSNADALIGRLGRVSEAVGPGDQRGRVAIDGDVWPARSEGGEEIAAGTTVVVRQMHSIVLTVSPATADDEKNEN